MFELQPVRTRTHRRPLHAGTGAVALLLASTLLSVALYAVRRVASGSVTYVFLNWNLFLAWVPFLAAGMAVLLQGDSTRPRFRTLPFLGIWLLFLPNAPYILTDLIHLAPREPIPLWYDLILLLSYAWNGLILGFVSIRMVQGLVAGWFGVAAGWLAATAALTASSFGVYLGRFERWNSWDLLLNPRSLLDDLAGGMLDPFAHPKALVVTLLLTCVLCAMYGTMLLLAHGHPTGITPTRSRS